MLRDRSPVLSRSTSISTSSIAGTYNVSPTQPSPSTFVDAAAVKESSSSYEPRPKNPKIQALLDEIVNDNDSKSTSTTSKS